MLRNIDPAMDSSIVSEIDARLKTLAVAEAVSIPWAIESGSRAWGFPSPDSDYDCRFVFARSMQDTIALFPKRDVIEMPITPIFDVGGWELGKALKLLLKGNAVIIEWLSSPIIYQGNEVFRTEFLNLANDVSDRGLIANHYLRLAVSMKEKTLKGSDTVPLKKLFYILRPLIALKWLLENPKHSVAPMHFPTLVRAVDLPNDLKNILNDLIAQKSKTKELGSGKMPEPVAKFIKSSFQKMAECPFQTHKPDPDKIERVEQFHFKWISRLTTDRT